MATIHIPAATVSRIIEGHGFACHAEKTTRKGETIREYYTVWSTSPAVKVGDIVEVSGELGVKFEEYQTRTGEKKQGIGIQVNSPKVSVEAPF